MSAAGCDVCGTLCELGASGTPRCPRCGARISERRPQSVQRSWAYLIAASIFYLPANFYPIFDSTTLQGTDEHTILGGIVELWQDGEHLLAGVVLLASVLIPILKLITMTLLLACVHWRTNWRLRERAALYRLIESIGRWSMLDIFVVALLVALVRMDATLSVDAEPGALAFGAVVVFTMLCTQSFDPRVMWDVVGANDARPPTPADAAHAALGPA